MALSLNDTTAPGGWVWRTVAILAVLTVGVTTATMNARFGYQLGEDPLARWTLMVFSVALDVFKWIAPIAAATAWQRGLRLRASAAVLLWLVAGGWSFAAAIGFSAVNRDTTVAARTDTIGARVRAEADWQAAQRTLTMLQASPRWTATQACTNATAPASIAYCAELNAARTALDRAAPRLDASQGIASADPQAELLVRVFGFALPTAQLALTLLVAIVAELMSMLGIFAVSGTAPARLQPAGPSRAADDALRLRQTPTETVLMAETASASAPPPIASDVPSRPAVMKRPPPRIPPRRT